MDLGDITGSSGFQLGYPILNALLAASGPRGYRAAQAGNVGLGIANKFAEQQKQDTQNAILRQKLGDIFKATDQKPAATLPGSTTNLGLASEEAAGLQGLNTEGSPPEATAATSSFGSLAPQPTEVAPATSKPMFNPQMQKLGEALAAANRPDLALGVAERALTAKQQPMQHFGSPETGYYGIAPGETTATQIVPGVGRRQPTPPRPVVGAYGTMVPSKDPTTGEWTWPSEPTPANEPPARQLSPEEATYYGARTGAANAAAGASRAHAGEAAAHTGEINQRTARLKALTEQLNNPKLTEEKATTIFSAAIRDREALLKSGSDDPEDVQRLADANALVDSSRRRLAALQQQKAGPGAAPAPAAPGGGGGPPNSKPIGMLNGKMTYESLTEKDPKTGKPKRFVAN